ncbi:hypothetical protein P8C59_004005 [Phyllachora maydis]|uniref:Uncharacterized protein n=1 Tax=Phyllachora maydis TaxID=1825666 RepID=A0AAD9MC05_9PEZI|nr:hypothetical protein P8C59_004005 [Phyllachora maydis]
MWKTSSTRDGHQYARTRADKLRHNDVKPDSTDRVGARGYPSPPPCAPATFPNTPDRSLTPSPNHNASWPTAKPTFPSANSRFSHLPTPGLTALYELSRYNKIVRRLLWKCQFLHDAWARTAVALSPSSTSAELEAASRAQTEAILMSKLDFFEYYMLVERALVHLQGVFGITISNAVGGAPFHAANWSGQQRHGLAASRFYTAAKQENGTGERRGGKWSHAFHANVLLALDDKTNPLHEVLGLAPVRHELQRAKDLRNRWKNVDQEEGEGLSDKAPPLEAYDLQRMLSVIFEGLDAAYRLANEYVHGPDVDVVMREAEAAQEGQLNDDPRNWDFIHETETMDWEPNSG